MITVLRELPLAYAVLSAGRRVSSAALAGPSSDVIQPRRPLVSSTARVRLHLKPGQKGTKQLLAPYGDRLICVRYRYDAKRKKRLKTVDLFVEERNWQPPRPRFADDRIVGLRVAFTDLAVRDRVKQAGGIWNREQRLWQLRHDRAIALGLKSRIVNEPASNARCPRRRESISMQMPGQHPDKDACIHRWMPASRGRWQRVQSNSSSATQASE